MVLAAATTSTKYFSGAMNTHEYSWMFLNAQEYSQKQLGRPGAQMQQLVAAKDEFAKPSYIGPNSGHASPYPHQLS